MTESPSEQTEVSLQATSSSSVPAMDISMIPEKVHHPVFTHFWLAKTSVLFIMVQVISMATLPRGYRYCSLFSLLCSRHSLSQNKDQAYTKLGFSNWKKAIDKHERTISHHQAVELISSIPNTTKNVGEMLSGIYAQQKTENRVMLRMILTSIRYLARQGLAFRGRFKISDESSEGCEIDSNFIQLLNLRKS